MAFSKSKHSWGWMSPPGRALVVMGTAPSGPLVNSHTGQVARCALFDRTNSLASLRPTGH